MSLLDEFARQVKQKLDEVNACSGKKARDLQTKLSVYISEQSQKLMKQGVPIMVIQDALRAASGEVEQTYAPDADDTDEETGEKLEAPISATTYFLPMEESMIASFTAGDLDGAELMGYIRAAADITPLEMAEGVDLVLSDFGKNQALSNLLTAGEIVAGSDGEAFLPEHLQVKDADGYQYLVCDPALFKSAGEVHSIAILLEPLNQKAFIKKANIRKLIKSGWLNAFDPRSVKKEAAYIIDELWKEFAVLRELYFKASEQKKGMLIFEGYQGEEAVPVSAGKQNLACK